MENPVKPFCGPAAEGAGEGSQATISEKDDLMKKVKVIFVVAVIAAFCSGCAVNLPFNNRLSYSSVSTIKGLSAAAKGPVSVKWVPPSFPDRVDVQGASGYVGGASQTRIPIGEGLANRIVEGLDNALGVTNSSNNILTIDVYTAKTEFEYSAGIFNVTPAIDVARCTFEAEFSIGKKRWKERFYAELKDPTIGGSSQTGVVEKVWDDIAIQVVKNILDHL